MSLDMRGREQEKGWRDNDPEEGNHRVQEMHTEQRYQVSIGLCVVLIMKPYHNMVWEGMLLWKEDCNPVSHTSRIRSKKCKSCNPRCQLIEECIQNYDQGLHPSSLRKHTRSSDLPRPSQLQCRKSCHSSRIPMLSNARS